MIVDPELFNISRYTGLPKVAGISVGVNVGVTNDVLVGGLVDLTVGVPVEVNVDVGVSVSVAVGLGLDEAVTMAVCVGVGKGAKTLQALSPRTSTIPEIFRNLEMKKYDANNKTTLIFFYVARPIMVEPTLSSRHF